MKRHYIFLLFLLSLMIVGGVDATAQTVDDPQCNHGISNDGTIGGSSIEWWSNGSFSPFYKLETGETLIFSFYQKSASSGRSWVLYVSDVASHSG